MIESDSRMEGTTERKMTSEKSDVVENDFGNVECGRGSKLDSESCEHFEKNS